jgi:hypothetical protein
VTIGLHGISVRLRVLGAENTMTTRPPSPAGTDEEKTKAPGTASEPRPGEYAVSPAIGPVPVIYVPQSPRQPSAAALARRAAARAAYLARGWAAGLRHRVRTGGTMPDTSARNPDGRPRLP